MDGPVPFFFRDGYKTIYYRLIRHIHLAREVIIQSQVLVVQNH